MKTFIYFSQCEWRTFKAEELPVKPHEFIDQIEQYDIWQEYESEIAALKAKSLKVGNSEILEKVSLAEACIVETSVPILEWPGTVEVKEELEYPIDHTSYPPYIEVGILKLP